MLLLRFCSFSLHHFASHLHSALESVLILYFVQLFIAFHCLHITFPAESCNMELESNDSPPVMPLPPPFSRKGRLAKRSRPALDAQDSAAEMDEIDADTAAALASGWKPSHGFSSSASSSSVASDSSFRFHGRAALPPPPTLSTRCEAVTGSCSPEVQRLLFDLQQQLTALQRDNEAKTQQIGVLCVVSLTFRFCYCVVSPFSSFQICSVVIVLLLRLRRVKRLTN